MLHGQHQLHQPGHTRRHLQVSKIRLDGAHNQRLAALPKYRTQRPDLDRIAEGVPVPCAST